MWVFFFFFGLVFLFLFHCVYLCVLVCVFICFSLYAFAPLAFSPVLFLEKPSPLINN